MSGLFGDSKAARQQAAQEQASARGSALAQLLAQEAQLDKENAAQGSTRRARGKRLLRALSDEDGAATLG